jgi:hypothetical protein
VNTLASGDQKPGYYNVTWNFGLGTRSGLPGNPVMSRCTCACGVNFCVLVAEGQRFSRKVVLTE